MEVTTGWRKEEAAQATKTRGGGGTKGDGRRVEQRKVERLQDTTRGEKHRSTVTRSGESCWRMEKKKKKTDDVGH